MSKKERIARKALLAEQEEFVPLLLRVSEFVEQNKKKLYGGLAGIITVGLVVFGVQYFAHQSQDKAYDLFEQGLMTSQMPEIGTEPNTKDQIRINDFDEIIKRYPNTEAGRLTFVVYGDHHYEKANYDEAIELYLKALEAYQDDPSMKAFVLNGIGYCYEEKKDYKAASEYFLKIIDLENGILKATAHFNLGRIYEAMGDPATALTHYVRIIKDYPDSIHFQAARNKVSRL
ncbi:MAG: tetratricopeptide repeat protein [Deltaproteobacteria bacterium]|nr:tetratricopeptide repeat protein [Deltaproteobacteria bacterium]